MSSPRDQYMLIAENPDNFVPGSPTYITYGELEGPDTTTTDRKQLREEWVEYLKDVEHLERDDVVDFLTHSEVRQLIDTIEFPTPATHGFWGYCEESKRFLVVHVDPNLGVDDVKKLMKREKRLSKHMKVIFNFRDITELLTELETELS